MKFPINHTIFKTLKDPELYFLILCITERNKTKTLRDVSIIHASWIVKHEYEGKFRTPQGSLHLEDTTFLKMSMSVRLVVGN